MASNKFLIVMMTASAGCSGLVLETPGTEPPPHLQAEVRELIRLVNYHRAAIDCKPLVWDDAVGRVAQGHSEDMVRRSFFSHINPDGESPFQRLSDAHISYRRAAENIAAGQQTARGVLAGWLSSSGHRENIEECRYTHHGVGLDQAHWTHVFIGK